jgi:hypothetical protein
MLPVKAGKKPKRDGPPMVATQIEDGVTTWIAKYKLPKKFKKGQLIRLGVKDRVRGTQIVLVKIT